MRKGEQKVRGDGVGVGEGEREGAEEERRMGVVAVLMATDYCT